MQALIEKIQTEGPQVIQGGDNIYAKDFPRNETIKYEEPNEYEKDMLKNTLKAEALLEREKTEKALVEDARRDVITKAKVIALDKMGCYPLTNPSFFSKKDKALLIKHMEELLTYTDEIITRLFNQVCTDKIFTDKADYSNFPTYQI